MPSPNDTSSSRRNGTAVHPVAEPIRLPYDTADQAIPTFPPGNPAPSEQYRREVRRSQPIIGEPVRSRSVTPVMSDGIALKGFTGTLEQVHGKTYPLHLARLRFFDESAAESYRQLERIHDAVAQESARRSVRQEARLPSLVAEIAALGNEERAVQKAIEESHVADRKSTRLNSSHSTLSRMPSSA